MPPNRQIEHDLKIASETLKKELRGLPGLHLKRKHHSWETDTLGRAVTLATWGLERPQLELWLDQAAGRGVYRFWYGFSTKSEEKMRNLLKKLPDELAPGRPFTEKDWEPLTDSKTSRHVVFKAQSKLTRPFWECYKKWDDPFFFGDWGGDASETSMQLDAWGAGVFIRNVVKSVSGDEKLEAPNDEELEGFEGTEKKLFILHRKREAKLRNQKIRQVLRLNGTLVCEVPNCGFDFAKRYGKLGNEYAQVITKCP